MQVAGMDKLSCVSLQANHDSGQSAAAVSNKSSPRREILGDPLSRVEPGLGWAPLQAAVSAKDRCLLYEA